MTDGRSSFRGSLHHAASTQHSAAVGADVDHLAEYLLGDPAWCVADPEEQARRIVSLAHAVREAVIDWLDAHPLEART